VQTQRQARQCQYLKRHESMRLPRLIDRQRGIFLRS
jgi:hypothetical protein